MVRGKEKGKAMNEIRTKIQRAKEKLENRKRENAVNSLVEGKEVDDPIQEALENEILALKE
jgi:hypothetical protein